MGLLDQPVTGWVFFIYAFFLLCWQTAVARRLDRLEGQTENEEEK